MVGGGAFTSFNVRGPFVLASVLFEWCHQAPQLCGNRFPYRIDGFIGDGEIWAPDGDKRHIRIHDHASFLHWRDDVLCLDDTDSIPILRFILRPSHTPEWVKPGARDATRWPKDAREAWPTDLERFSTFNEWLAGTQYSLFSDTAWRKESEVVKQAVEALIIPNIREGDRENAPDIPENRVAEECEGWVDLEVPDGHLVSEDAVQNNRGTGRRRPSPLVHLRGGAGSDEDSCEESDSEYLPSSGSTDGESDSELSARSHSSRSSSSNRQRSSIDSKVLDRSDGGISNLTNFAGNCVTPSKAFQDLRICSPANKGVGTRSIPNPTNLTDSSKSALMKQSSRTATKKRKEDFKPSKELLDVLSSKAHSGSSSLRSSAKGTPVPISGPRTRKVIPPPAPDKKEDSDYSLP